MAWKALLIAVPMPLTADETALRMLFHPVWVPDSTRLQAELIAERTSARAEVMPDLIVFSEEEMLDQMLDHADRVPDSTRSQAELIAERTEVRVEDTAEEIDDSQLRMVEVIDDHAD